MTRSLASPFSLVATKHCLGISGAINKKAPETIAGGATAAETQFDYAALTDEDPVRQHAAVFRGHAAFDCLEHVGPDAPIIDEQLGAELDPHSSYLAPVFIGGAFVGILEPPQRLTS
ncbi:hypothetical protein [Mesorhizobium argentiipisi]|uniref:GAF domain-containing protein n=1 Tax=Mesorhizobium argentiipisi TaxID=3015175 RepID=A0ABU8KME0_9HYPH